MKECTRGIPVGVNIDPAIIFGLVVFRIGYTAFDTEI